MPRAKLKPRSGVDGEGHGGGVLRLQVGEERERLGEKLGLRVFFHKKLLCGSVRYMMGNTNKQATTSELQPLDAASAAANSCPFP